MLQGTRWVIFYKPEGVIAIKDVNEKFNGLHLYTL